MNARDSYLKRKYGITEAQYEEMLKSQSGCCALCGRHQSQFSRRLHVEHNHSSGKVRSLCCFRCNKLYIGRHNLGTAKQLYEYMKRYDG